MIPKKIHYCWFGDNPLPELAIKCIESWKKFCPDYEIIEWNETNFDVHCCAYVCEAFEAKKWAFITDYVRLKVMVEHGGIYMDTDVEVVKPLDKFLNEQAFSGFETERTVQTGIMACEKGFPLFIQMMKEYENKCFILPDGSFNTVTNVKYITSFCLEKGLKLNNRYQHIEGFALYPSDYFCPKSYLTKEVYCTKNTYAIHHFAASWYTEKQNKWSDLEGKIVEKIGGRKASKVFHLRLWKLFRHIYAFGVLQTIKRIKMEWKGEIDGKPNV